MLKRYHPSKDFIDSKKRKLSQKNDGGLQYKPTLAKKVEKAVMGAVIAFSMAACGGSDHKQIISKTSGLNHRLTGYVGSVTADEPQAAMMARDILIRGGNAADAATALGLALTVTLPSRASLGGGGACLAYRPGEAAQSILFLPQPGTTQPQNKADRPASIPMMARGLYLLQASYGKSDINDILRLVGNLAGNGIPVSDLLASDLAAVQSPLFEDPAVQKLFMNSEGRPLKAGDVLYQPRLKIIYDRLITSGVADLYIGSLARSYALGSQIAGGGLNSEDFRNALPVQAPALSLNQGSNITYFLSPPADGGLGMAMAMRDGEQSGSDSIAQGTIAKWRAGNSLSYTKLATLEAIKKAQAWLDAGQKGNGALPALPASTSFSVVDRNGEAVSCALTMNNLFGTGRISGTTGIIMAASPRQFPQPLLTAAVTTYKQRFVASIAASGQNDAAQAAASTLDSFLKQGKGNHNNNLSISHANTSQGRVNMIYCADGLPGNVKQCHAYTDPNGAGLAISD